MCVPTASARSTRSKIAPTLTHLIGSTCLSVFAMAWSRGLQRSIQKPTMFPFRPPKILRKYPRRKSKEEMKPPPEQPASSKSGVLHEENKPLHEIVGDKEVWSIDAGGKDRTTMGFRTQTDMFDVLRQQIIGADYIPQRKHEPRPDQHGMDKYVNWTE